MKKRNFWLALFWIALGLILFVTGILGNVDSALCGMGGGLIGVGCIQLIRYLRWKKDPEFREKWETENKDERNRFLADKACAWAFTMYVILGGVGVIVLQILGIRELAYEISWAVCALLILYWVSYLFLRKKY